MDHVNRQWSSGVLFQVQVIHKLRQHHCNEWDLVIIVQRYRQSFPRAHYRLQLAPAVQLYTMTCQNYHSLTETMRTTITCTEVSLTKTTTFHSPTTHMRCKHWRKTNTLGMMESTRQKLAFPETIELQHCRSIQCQDRFRRHYHIRILLLCWGLMSSSRRLIMHTRMSMLVTNIKSRDTMMDIINPNKNTTTTILAQVLEQLHNLDTQRHRPRCIVIVRRIYPG
jgi:hypothetical protein